MFPFKVKTLNDVFFKLNVFVFVIHPATATSHLPHYHLFKAADTSLITSVRFRLSFIMSPFYKSSLLMFFFSLLLLKLCLYQNKFDTLKLT